MNLQDIVLPLADLIVWTFDTILVPIGHIFNRTGWEVFWICVGLAGLAVWLRFQAKYNAEAKANPDQIK